MVPLLQARTSELPFVPSALEGVAFLTVFVGQRLPGDTPVASGSGWLIRTYSSLEGLASTLVAETGVRPFPVRWSLLEGDAPQWEDAWAARDHRAFYDLGDSQIQYSDRFTTSYATKVRGWPSYIQGSAGEPSSDTFVLQIATEPKAYWGRGDAGNGYVYKSASGQWWLGWDCY